MTAQRATYVTKGEKALGFGVAGAAHGRCCLDDRLPRRAEGTIVYGINNADEMAGIWGDRNDNPHAFVYDAASGQFKLIVEKGTDNGKYAVSYGLNNEGLVVVNFVAADGPFIYCPPKASQCPSEANAGFKFAANAKQP